MSESVDWSVLDDTVTGEVMEQASRRIYRRVADFFDLEDVEQDARIILALDHEAVKGYIEEVNYGGMQHRLEQRLINLYEPLTKRLAKAKPQCASEELAEARAQVQPAPDAAYDRTLVEYLLPAVWDESYAYGLPRMDTAPDPDMPRGASNPATANNLPAYLADIRTGWKRAPLTLRERRAVFMRYALDWRTVDIAAHEWVSKQTISARLYTAVGKIVARLNGGVFYELEGVEA